ncbi:MAG TPA: carboxymuconolactone decarboxylase family protein [Solirubrobacteraceae bacterium]|jgi:alkylhydroperoxidase family enzyme
MTDPATRLKMVPIEEFDPELRTLVAADDKTLLELGGMQIHAHRPSHAKAIVALHDALWTDRLLPDRLLELVRLRIAFFNQCRSCMAIRYPGAIADGLTEDLVCSLEQPYTAADLSHAERAAIHFGELLATDHLAIDDAVYDDLRRHFTEAQIVELGSYCAFCVGFGRLSATWNMIEELPERFHDGDVATPWGGEAITVR